MVDTVILMGITDSIILNVYDVPFIQLYQHTLPDESLRSGRAVTLQGDTQMVINGNICITNIAATQFWKRMRCAWQVAKIIVLCKLDKV